MPLHRKREKNLGVFELIAIALGGMVGGGIFTILGIAVSKVGNLTPIAIILGGVVALLAAYSYVKLGVYYKDEGATYSFFKRTFPNSKFYSATLGWYIIFGYISTLALYAYTFSSYALSSTEFSGDSWSQKLLAIVVIGVFAGINLWSVNGMGKIEDIMVYCKLVILVVISVVLFQNSDTSISNFWIETQEQANSNYILSVLIVASITFVAYEGFQLVINAVKEMKAPEKSIPRAIYSAIGLAIFIYVIISIAALFAIPKADIIINKEFALAAGAGDVLGMFGANVVILGAILATSSAISGTLFGSSRQMAVIAKDKYMPFWFSKHKNKIPVNAIIGMALLACFLVLIGGLEIILEFGSVTFLLVSILMAYANYKKRAKTNSSKFITLLAMFGLGTAGILIIYYEFLNNWKQMLAIISLYIILSVAAWFFAKRKKSQT